MQHADVTDSRVGRLFPGDWASVQAKGVNGEGQLSFLPKAPHHAIVRYKSQLPSLFKRLPPTSHESKPRHVSKQQNSRQPVRNANWRNPLCASIRTRTCGNPGVRGHLQCAPRATRPIDSNAVCAARAKPHVETPHALKGSLRGIYSDTLGSSAFSRRQASRDGHRPGIFQSAAADSYPTWPTTTCFCTSCSASRNRSGVGSKAGPQTRTSIVQVANTSSRHSTSSSNLP